MEHELIMVGIGFIISNLDNYTDTMSDFEDK